MLVFVPGANIDVEQNDNVAHSLANKNVALPLKLKFYLITQVWLSATQLEFIVECLRVQLSVYSEYCILTDSEKRSQYLSHY